MEMDKPVLLGEEETRAQVAERMWRERMGQLPPLDDSSTAEDIDREAQGIRKGLVEVLDRYARKLRITARSKRWWSDTIRERRKSLGQAINRLRRGHGAGQVKEARRALKREIHRAKRECWDRYLQEAQGSDVWNVVKYTQDQRTATSTMGTIRHGTVKSTSADEKREMMASIACPPQNGWRNLNQHSVPVARGNEGWDDSVSM